ncbi:MAG: hypothetical protein AAB463_00255 [Patescibacteria group bacterium]
MKNDALEKAKSFVLDKQPYFNCSGTSIGGYVIAAGLVALAEQLGNIAEAIKSREK